MKIKVDTSQLDVFISGLTSFSSDIDSIADELLDAAESQLVSAYKGAVQSAANRGYSTGAAAGSVSSTGARKNSYGHFIAVRPTGSDKRGERNAEKVALLNYGTSRQAAHPVLSQAVAQVDSSITETIKNAIEAKATEYCGE